MGCDISTFLKPIGLCTKMYKSLLTEAIFGAVKTHSSNTKINEFSVGLQTGIWIRFLQAGTNHQMTLNYLVLELNYLE